MPAEGGFPQNIFFLKRFVNMWAFILLLSLFCLGCTSSEKRRVELSNLKELPLSPWQKASFVERYKRSDLSLLLGQESQLILPFAVEEVQVLAASRGDLSVEITGFRSKGVTEAYRIFTVLRALLRSGESFEAGCEAFRAQGKVLLWKGRWVFSLSFPRESSQNNQILLELAERMADQIRGECRYPYLVRALPEDNLVKSTILCFRSEKTFCLLPQIELAKQFSLNKEISSKPKAEGFYAQYAFESGDAEFCILIYRTEDYASEAEKKLAELLSSTSLSISRRGTLEEYMLPNRRWVLVLRQGRLLIVVLPTTQKRSATNVILSYIKNLSRELSTVGRKEE